MSAPQEGQRRSDRSGGYSGSSAGRPGTVDSVAGSDSLAYSGYGSETVNEIYRDVAFTDITRNIKKSQNMLYNNLYFVL